MLASVLASAIITSGEFAKVQIRGSLRQVVYQGKSIRTTRQPVKNVKVRAMAGRSDLIITWDEVGVPFYGISMDGKTWPQVSSGGTKLRLRYQEFDPLQTQPVIEPELASRRGESLVVVQFHAQIIPAFLDLIRETGGEPISFLADNAYICRLTEDQREKLADQAVVRWVGELAPAYRLDPALQTWALRQLPGAKHIRLELTTSNDAAKLEIADQIRMLGGEAVLAPGGRFMDVSLTAVQTLEILRSDLVLWVDEGSAPQDDMILVRNVGGANLLAGLSPAYNGEGIRGEVMDGGYRDTHFDFQRTPTFFTRSNGSSRAHGTSTTGIVFGSGTGNVSGKGLLPAAQGMFGTYNSLAGFGGSTSRQAWTQALINAPYNGMFQSNSWGTTTTLDYTSYSTEMDQITFDLDFLVFQSQSNTGDQTSRPQAWAKNVVSVGGINHLGTENLLDDQWSTASIGPAADGRVKPDICNWYDSIFCPTSSSDNAYTTSFGGTSAATPITAGFTGLFLQLWADGAFGNSVTATTPFLARPRTTLSKAMMINQATQYTFNGINHNLGRFKQGWGLSNVGNLYNNRNGLFFVNETDVLLPFETKTYQVYVAAGAPLFKATMTYLDRPGTTNSTLHRINDLSLKVTAPNGTVYYGNNGLTTEMTSTAGGVANTIDTVENVILNAPAAGTYTVEVRADALNGDGRPETGNVDADFSLVVSGVSMTAIPSAYTLEKGVLDGGTVADLATSNNRRLVFDKADEPNDLAYDEIRQSVTGTAPMANPSQLSFRVEANNTEANVSQQIELFNYVTNAWEVVDSTALNGSGDNFREVTITTNAARFVNASNREVKARIRWWMFIINDVAWTIGADQERWFFRP